MLDKIFSTIITNDSDVKVYFFICLGAALVLGFSIALSFTYRSRYSKSFLTTLTMIPAIVALLIMIVNGNIGTGIAVAGAFSLIRFRSAQGTAREIGYIFLATAVGLAVGTGYIGIAAIFTVVMILVFTLLSFIKFGEAPESIRQLRITIPESLDYSGVFDDLFEKYTTRHQLIRVKTSNMGSLFRLEYRIVMKDVKQEKEMINEIRIRNGNLDISCSIDYNESDERL